MSCSVCLALIALVVIAEAMSPQRVQISSSRDLLGEESAPTQRDHLKAPSVIRPVRRRKVPRGPQTGAATIKQDLETAPTHHHHDHHGWLDMGAYSGHHGAFGW